MASLLSLEDVRAAARTITGHVERTPTVASPGMSALLGVPVTLTLELLQRSGSFKPRGVATRLLALSPVERDAGVVAVSGGNHGIAVAEVAVPAAAQVIQRSHDDISLGFVVCGGNVTQGDVRGWFDRLL